MNRVNRFISAVVLALFFAGAATADTLELKDGRVLKGKYLGGTQAVLRFELNGEVQTFNTADIVALTFTGYSRGAAPEMAPPAAVAPGAAHRLAPRAPRSNVTLRARSSCLGGSHFCGSASKNHVG